eukprot:m.441387 g.441387  ORF g.441387 m.441387 type:complete len:107 (-) comp56798_c0_seq4:3713-4033(-)
MWLIWVDGLFHCSQSILDQSVISFVVKRFDSYPNSIYMQIFGHFLECDLDGSFLTGRSGTVSTGVDLGVGSIVLDRVCLSWVGWLLFCWWIGLFMTDWFISWQYTI